MACLPEGPCSDNLRSFAQDSDAEVCCKPANELHCICMPAGNMDGHTICYDSTHPVKLHEVQCAHKAGRQAGSKNGGVKRTVVVLLCMLISIVVSLEGMAEEVHQVLAIIQHNVYLRRTQVRT